MRRIFLVWTALILLAGAPGPAQSQDAVEAARTLYGQGDYDAAIATARPAAEAGNATAQNLLGAAYEAGRGVPQDTAQALMWYTRAADQGFDKALYNLGLLYLKGAPGVEPDAAQAMAYFEAAAALDYWAAFSNLGRMFEEGQGVPVDDARAAELYARGVAASDPHSANNLAHLYYEGRGVARDLDAARAHWTLAAELGSPEGFNNLALLQQFGEGGPMDLDAALASFRGAVALDYALAGNNAARLIMANPDHFDDQVPGLALCLWSVSMAAPDRAEAFAQDCELFAVAFTKAEVAAARQMALTF